ncbi:hypothetical protein NDK43_03440 [Neobacillus pocheonensis]|uniref:HTH crp-type domain-containing protein n=1 Tax=Neobacillus pocheonensis TaxID=363869 RepID=A0ABT0W7M5_9BACI|nr:hypothetical protein [Neobacillus pocheonensis]
MAILSIKGGLYSIIIRLCNSYVIMTEDGILIDLPLTHQELANLTYGTREVIQRSLKENSVTRTSFHMSNKNSQ